jgi:serine/threonine protein kinase
MEQFQFLNTEEKASRYVYLSRIGEGTFGEVRKVRDSVSGEVRAVKHIRLMSKRGANGLPKAVFRECETLKQLSDGIHIVRLYDIYATDVSVCLVMEYMDHDLSDVILHSQPYIPIQELKCYFQMMIKAVDFCHSHHIMHRDIKPSSKCYY